MKWRDIWYSFWIEEFDLRLWRFGVRHTGWFLNANGWMMNVVTFYLGPLEICYIRETRDKPI